MSGLPKNPKEHAQEMLHREEYLFGSGGWELGLAGINGPFASLSGVIYHSKAEAHNHASYILEILVNELTRAEARSRAASLREAADLAQQAVGDLKFVAELRRRADEAADQDVRVLKYSDDVPEDRIAADVAALEEEYGKGRVKVQKFPSGKLKTKQSYVDEIIRQNETDPRVPDGVIALVHGDQVQIAHVGKTEEELRALVDAPSEFEQVRAEMTVEAIQKARLEKRCPKCNALLMPTGTPEGQCPNDCCPF